MLTSYKIEEIEYCSVRNFTDKDYKYYTKEILYVLITFDFSESEEWKNLIEFMKENGYDCFFDYRTIKHDYQNGFKTIHAEFWRFVKEKGKEEI